MSNEQTNFSSWLYTDNYPHLFSKSTEGATNSNLKPHRKQGCQGQHTATKTRRCQSSRLDAAEQPKSSESTNIDAKRRQCRRFRRRLGRASNRKPRGDSAEERWFRQSGDLQCSHQPRTTGTGDQWAQGGSGATGCTVHRNRHIRACLSTCRELGCRRNGTERWVMGFCITKSICETYIYIILIYSYLYLFAKDQLLEKLYSEIVWFVGHRHEIFK